MQTTEYSGKKIFKAKALAQILDCGASTIYALAKAGKIPSISIGKLGIRIDLDAVLEALKRR